MDVNQAVFYDGIMTAINNLILFGLVVLFRQAVHREGIRSFLLHADRRGRRLLIEGVAIGCLLFLIYPLITTVSNHGVVTVARDTVSPTIGLLLTAGFGFMCVALLEEGLFRGYVLQKLLKRFPQPDAIGLAAIPFGLLHLISYPESDFLWLGLLNAGLFGVLFSLAVIGSGSLMWAVGFHLAWNLTQNLLLINQLSSVNTFFNLQINEGILTGTPSTPESGILVTAILAIAGIYAYARFYRQLTPRQPTIKDAG